MANDRPPAKVLAFGRVWRFPADLDRFRRVLDDEDDGFAEADIDAGLACAEAAITQSVPGGHEVKADLLNVRAHRVLAADGADAALAAWAQLIALYPTYLDAYVSRALILDKRGDREAAIAELDVFLGRSPTDARGYIERAKLYKAQGDDDRALANFRRAAVLDPAAFDEHLTMALLLGKKGDVPGAARMYARHAEQEFADAESYKSRGFLFFLGGQEELSLADYDASVALAPKDPDALAWRGILRMRAGRLNEAIADFTRIVSLTPDAARGYEHRAEALVRSGKHAEAIRDIERAIALGGDEKGAAHIVRGRAQEGLGDAAAALASYDTAVERDPTNTECRLRRFAIHDRAENWLACQIDIDAMLANAPDDGGLLLARARLCVRNGRRDDARVAYDRFIALEPNNADVYYERSNLLVGFGCYAEAHADLARAFELAPGDPAIQSSYGRSQAMTAKSKEDRAEALRLIAGSADLDAENPEAWLRATYDCRGAGFPEEAVALISRAIELDPDNAEYYAERATCLRCAASPSDPVTFQASVFAALRDVDRAFALSDDEDFERYCQRADLREEAGDLDGALRDLTKMIEMEPDSIDAHMERARLRKLMGDLPGALADAARVAAIEDEWIADVAKLPDPSKFELTRFSLDEA